jgi:serine/threonine-protein kinase
MIARNDSSPARLNLRQEAGSPMASPVDDSHRRAIYRVSKIALWAWPAFHALDVFMIWALYPSAPYAKFLGLRCAGELGVLATLILARRGKIGDSALHAAHLASYVFLALAISIMALDFGGPHSSYVHGISIVLVVRAMLVPTRFWRALAQAALPTLSFPLVMAMASGSNENGHGSWVTPDALSIFVSHYIFVVGSMVVASAASHLAWTAQQQIYRTRRLGRYRLEAPLARGGMGEVWLASDEMLSRKVALKLLRTQAHMSPAILARFEREARAASQLTNPHTVAIFDFGSSDDGIHFIVMEYLPGADLGVLVENHGPMPAARAVKLIRQACVSLAEAHEAGIVHRDVKPTNLYVTQYEQNYDFLKVLDFGIAWVEHGDIDPRLTRTGVVPGTPAFMAPEVRLGHRGDVRSDIYSLGATLHYLLTGAAPAPSPLNAPRSEYPKTGSATHAMLHIPPSLAAVVSRCLSSDPSERPQSARALAAALDACEGLGDWGEEDARRFWQVTHRHAIARWTAPTSGS